MPINLNLNYPGSSGYGVFPTGRYGRMTGDPVATTPDYGVFDVSSGKVVSILTGKPWQGVEPRTGVSYLAGAPSAASANTVNAPGIGPINPNDPSQRYRAVDVVKSPDIAAAQSDLMAQFKKTADASLQHLNDYLKNFETDIGSARTAAARATDTTGTEAGIRAATDQYGNALDSSNAAYQRALAESAAAQRGVVSQANADLPMYDAAINNVQGIANSDLIRALSKYKLGSGVPTAPSSYDTAIMAREAARAAAPFELEKVNRRYDILGRMALPVEQGIGAEAMRYAGSFLPSVAASRYGAGMGEAQTIQDLRTRIAGMSMDNAIRFMQSAGVPAQIMQQVLSGQISQLGGLSQLEDQSRYRGLQDVLGANLSQPISYNMAMPPLPNYPSRYPTSGLPQPGNAPVTVAPQRTTTGTTGGYDPYAYLNERYANDPMALQRYDLYGIDPATYGMLDAGGGGYAPVPNIGSQTPPEYFGV